MTPATCDEIGCVAEATFGTKCAVHHAGYRRHDGSKRLFCARCEREIKTGIWYVPDPELQTVTHVKPCKRSEWRR